jgi:predicted nucleotidyltransferase
MNLDELKKYNYIIFECDGGSHAYNLYTAKSDFDTRGIYRRPVIDYLRITNIEGEVKDDKNDTVFYDFKKYLQLAKDVNPNILELMWTDNSNIRFMSSVMEKLIKNRNLFISSRAFYTFSGYAHAQIKKAKGQNKRVWNPQPEKRPVPMDFVRIIIDWPDQEMAEVYTAGYTSTMPIRPVPIKETKIDLSLHHVAALEHVPNTFRLYYYGDKAKGVFRGSDKDGWNIIPESIPMEDEWHRIVGLLVYNKDEYTQAANEWEQYWTWHRERNTARWVSQENGEVNYDLKNMMHCFRLFFSCKNIFTNGEPIVKFSTESTEYKFLMGIRNGGFKYEYLMNLAEQKILELEQLYKESKLPYEVDSAQIDNLFVELVNM